MKNKNTPLFCLLSRVPSAHVSPALHRPATHLGLWLFRRPVCALQGGLLPGQRQQVLQQGRVWRVLRRGERRWDDKWRREFCRYLTPEGKLTLNNVPNPRPHISKVLILFSLFYRSRAPEGKLRETRKHRRSSELIILHAPAPHKAQHKETWFCLSTHKICNVSSPIKQKSLLCLSVSCLFLKKWLFLFIVYRIPTMLLPGSFFSTSFKISVMPSQIQAD